MLALVTPRTLLFLAAVLAALAVIFWSYAAGRDAVRVEGLQSTLNTLEARDAIDRNVARRPDGAAADRLLRDWARD